MVKESVHVYVKNEANELLLVKRRDVPVWVLPGGGIEEGETAEEAAIRETLEESGLQVELTRKIADYTPISSLASPSHLFEARVVGGNLTISSETCQVQFFSLVRLPKKIPPPFPDWIQDAMQETNCVLKKEITSVTYWKLIQNAFIHPFLVFRFLLSRLYR